MKVQTFNWWRDCSLSLKKTCVVKVCQITNNLLEIPKESPQKMVCPQFVIGHLWRGLGIDQLEIIRWLAPSVDQFLNPFRIFRCGVQSRNLAKPRTSCVFSVLSEGNGKRTIVEPIFVTTLEANRYHADPADRVFPALSSGIFFMMKVFSGGKSANFSECNQMTSCWLLPGVSFKTGTLRDTFQDPTPASWHFGSFFACHGHSHQWKAFQAAGLPEKVLLEIQEAKFREPTPIQADLFGAVCLGRGDWFKWWFLNNPETQILFSKKNKIYIVFLHLDQQGPDGFIGEEGVLLWSPGHLFFFRPSVGPFWATAMTWLALPRVAVARPWRSTLRRLAF